MMLSRPSDRRGGLTLLLLFVVLFLGTDSALSDVIHFKDGRTLEGKIVKQDAENVEIKTKFGTVKIGRDRIARIEVKESVTDVLGKRLKKLDRNDADAIFDLAMWCKEQGLKKDYRKLLNDALKADGQHDGANKEAGNILKDGRWFTPKELKTYSSEKAERMKAQGYVLYNGEWMPEAEVRKLQGYVEWEGEWITRMEEYHRKADRDIEKYFGYPMTITDSEHFSIRSRNGIEETHRELLDYCELELEHFLRTFQPDDVEHRMIVYFPIPVYILDDIDAAATFVDSGYVKRYRPPKEKHERHAPETNFSLYFPLPLVVLSEGRHLVGSKDRLTSQKGYMAHHVGHILIRRFKRGGKVPGWVETGVAHFYEGMTNFYQTLSICEFLGFEDTLKWTHGWGNFMEWKKQLANKTNHDRLPTVRGLFELKIQTMTSEHMAKAWSLVTFLLERYRERFIVFARRSYAPWRGEKELTQEMAWKVAFEDVTPEQVEAEWRKWILEQPISPARHDRLLLNPPKNNDD